MVPFTDIPSLRGVIDWGSSYQRLKTVFCTEKLTSIAALNEVKSKNQELEQKVTTLEMEVAKLRNIVIEQAFQLSQRPKSEGYNTGITQSNPSVPLDAVSEASGVSKRRQNRILDSTSDDDSTTKRTKRTKFYPEVLNKAKDFEPSKPIVSICI